MKKSLQLFALLVLTAQFALAQTDKTDNIINPSFEDNVDDLALGWTYEGGSDTLIWHVINTDGDETKTGSNICGLWNDNFGDNAITQIITGLPGGIYKLTADLMCSGNAESSRLTTQRIFINNKSVLFGVEGDYSSKTLSVLQDSLGEALSFAGHQVSPVGQENGPFQICEVIDTLTGGSNEIVIGIKTNGSASVHGFEFPNLTAGNGWGWFKIDNFTLTLMNSGTSAINSISNNEIKIIVNNGYVSIIGVEKYKIYTINGTLVQPNQQLIPGMYIVKSNENSTKFVVR